MGRTIRGVQTFIRFVQGAGVVSGDINGECAGLFASKLAPTLTVFAGWTRSNVGAGLLAKGQVRRHQCPGQWRRLRVSDGNSPNCLR